MSLNVLDVLLSPFKHKFLNFFVEYIYMYVYCIFLFRETSFLSFNIISNFYPKF